MSTPSNAHFRNLSAARFLVHGSRNIIHQEPSMYPKQAIINGTQDGKIYLQVEYQNYSIINQASGLDASLQIR